MLFVPKKSKFKKYHKGKSFKRISKQSNFVCSKKGSVALKSLEFGRITSKQIESIKQAIIKIIKKTGKLFINIFPQTAISKKPLEIRMGKGKGAVDHWVFKIQPGIFIVEIETNAISTAVKALTRARIRLPILTKIIFI
jgi:large subunit ribosomal protein L16